ncbi:MAG: PDDEXK nuclease domain-containing protein [Chlamydiota bacterium]
MKHPTGNPTIGIVIYREKNSFTVEYALWNSKSPIGVASYEAKIFKELPKKLESSLPIV